MVKGLGMQEVLFLPPSTANDVPKEWMHASVVYRVSETNPFFIYLNHTTGGCVKIGTPSFYAQRSNFPKLGLCYFLEFL